MKTQEKKQFTGKPLRNHMTPSGNEQQSNTFKKKIRFIVTK